MKRYVCIHGHFYQPPRENPWTEEIELQESAFPYPNWNERITAECYVPNSTSRILDTEGRTAVVVNNYAKINFNFGPTLLSWMERAQPDAYQMILEADRLSRKQFSGHGAAIAQGYNHMILPLANDRDKHTQVIWGIQDFQYRFKRQPQGMWLPETAVDTASLEILAEHGIRFTILSPRQARAVKKIGEKNWRRVKETNLDSQHPYLCRLPSGREIVLFFYDGSISHDLAFGGLLQNGETFANRMIKAFPGRHEDSRLAHVATDGETYGHHHRFGEMALSYCLHLVESRNLARITVYSEFLAKHPPQYEAGIVENSSWSCVHGIERWRMNCGCHLGGLGGRHQRWRRPLREAMDWLRDEMIPVYEKRMSEFCPAPWAVRNQYIGIILNRSKDNVEDFFRRNIPGNLSDKDKLRVFKLLEMQRHAMLMYTSCGWFFDDIAGIEAIQILRYAARAVQLAKEAGGVDLESHFIKKLESAPCNIAVNKNGAEIYRKFARTSRIRPLL